MNQQTFTLKLSAVAVVLIFALLLLGYLSATLKTGLTALAKPPPEGSEYLEPTPAPLGQSAVGSQRPALSQAEGSAVANSLDIVKLALTSSGSNQQVTNGETLTYTLAMTNNGTAVITDLLILDHLPNDALFDIQCSDDCHLISQTQTITDPFAGPIAITTTAEITWLVVSLDPGASIIRQIRGTAGCQADGAIIENTVFVNYWQGGQSKSGSAGAQITARARSETGGIALTVSSEPVWCSAGMRGVYDLDWGDFDGDGDFDLAVASAGGTAVYRNDQGRLTAFWETDEQAFSARWIDAVQQNGLLELAVAGEGPIPPASGVGTNYVYRPTATGFEQVSAFSSESAIFRLAVADYNGDGSPDLAAANLYESGTGCLLRLYHSSGSGDFTAGACPLSTGDLSGASSPRANTLVWADYDNDGDPDLAVGGARNGVDSFVEVRQNTGGVFGAGASIGATNLPPGNEVQATDLAWGDYNGDGYLDLAAGFMRAGSNGEARIYPNNQAGGFASPIVRAVSTSEMPVAIAWGDLNKDGVIDLSIADEQPKVYYG
ncbi:MAG TPA: DUF11 domain-containing protein, partial [Chloroflexi bacterium]|nr:DUF11 domain-containing protein [Chloroflexota bacterium]